MKVSTVKIATENGCVIINESDFDKDKHVLWSDKKEVKKPVKKEVKKAK